MVNKFAQISHEELALMAQRGDQEAEEFLIRAYKDLVRGKAHTYFIMGADGEDVVQEGMIGLFKAIKTYACGKEAGFQTYAELCITRQILDAIKAANRKKHAPLNTSVSLNKPVENEGTQTLEEGLSSGMGGDPEALLLMKDVIKFIGENEGKLFSDLEVKVWTGYMHGKSYSEIAAVLGKNQKSVYNAMERMKKKILSYLNDFE